ncbi:hypothetical protein HPB47_019009, partial [Ixodes persulcatus]
MRTAENPVPFLRLGYDRKWFSTIDASRTPCGSAEMMEDPVRELAYQSDDASREITYSDAVRTAMCQARCFKL